MSIPFRERNPVPIGAVGLLVIALLLFLAFNIQSIPLIGGGDHYRAAFSEAGGLIKGDDVRIAGVKVGKVEEGRPRRQPRHRRLQGHRAGGLRHRRPAPSCG